MKNIALFALAGSCMLGVAAAIAAPQAVPGDGKPVSAVGALGGAPAPLQPAYASQEPDMVYGYQLMTPEERVEYMNRMHAAGTFDERQKLREQHCQLMQERAKERGVTLPGMKGGAGMQP